MTIEEVIIRKARFKPLGYYYLRSPNHPNAGSTERIAEHRWIMEKHLGRFLDRNEVVHHKDHNRSNNDIDNLELMTAKQHRAHHNKDKTYSLEECPDCGKTTKLRNGKNCHNCYLKERRVNIPLENCSRCGKLRKLTSRKRMMCDSCCKGYNKPSKNA
jgi:hypothetical protein